MHISCFMSSNIYVCMCTHVMKCRYTSGYTASWIIQRTLLSKSTQVPICGTLTAIPLKISISRALSIPMKNSVLTLRGIYNIYNPSVFHLPPTLALSPALSSSLYIALALSVCFSSQLDLSPLSLSFSLSLYIYTIRDVCFIML